VSKIDRRLRVLQNISDLGCLHAHIYRHGDHSGFEGG
jgi:hypothetical protein